MKNSTLANAVDITDEKQVSSIIDSLEQRPLAERIRVVVRLLDAIESRYRSTLNLLDTTQEETERGGPWGYL